MSRSVDGAGQDLGIVFSGKKIHVPRSIRKCIV